MCLEHIEKAEPWEEVEEEYGYSLYDPNDNWIITVYKDDKKVIGAIDQTTVFEGVYPEYEQAVDRAEEKAIEFAKRN